MKIELTKPHKTEKRYRLYFEDCDCFNQTHPKKLSGLYLTKKEVIDIRDYLNNKTKNWRIK